MITEKRSFHHISSWFTEASPVAIFSVQPLWVFFGLDPISSIGTRTEIEARFRTLWAANHWQAPRGLGGSGFGHQDGRVWGGCYTWDPQACLRLRKENGTPYVRQNLGWGNMSLIVGQIKSFHSHPNKKEMNMMVSINLYGDVTAVHSSEIFLELFMFWVQQNRSPP